MMRTLISMLIVAAAAVVGLCSVAPAAEPVPQIVGGWKRINVNDPHIQELARWAVSEHDNQTGDGLLLSKVVSGQEQVIAGTNYKLVIQETKGAAGKRATYGVEVYENVYKTRQLLAFDPAN